MLGLLIPDRPAQRCWLQPLGDPWLDHSGIEPLPESRTSRRDQRRYQRDQIDRSTTTTCGALFWFTWIQFHPQTVGARGAATLERQTEQLAMK